MFKKTLQYTFFHYLPIFHLKLIFSYDDKSKSYYYYNNLTKKTQWEHPLDDIYRGLVKKARNESQSLSLHDNREDATYMADDILSMDEPISNTAVKKLDPLPLGKEIEYK